MNINFYDVENQQMYYTVINKECAFFNELDMMTMVGYLPVSTIYEIVEFFDIADDGAHWVKIKMHDGEYYALITPEKCVVAELMETKHKDSFVNKIIKKIKSIFKKNK